MVMLSLFNQHTLNEKTENEWLTPPEIIHYLGPFDLDPCAPEVRPWETAKRYYTKQDDGLYMEWTGRVWLNPPYRPEIDRWFHKMSLHKSGLAICFVRTDTRWFQRYVFDRAHSILFFSSRVVFCTKDGAKAKNNAGGPVCVVSWGQDDTIKLGACGISGHLIRLTNPADEVRKMREEGEK
jgi:hypothetical protein